MTVINIFDIWQSLLTLVNAQQGGQIPPWVFQNWYNAINVELFREKFNKYELVQQASDELKIPFLKTAVLAISGGVVPYPADYEYFSRMSILRQRDEKKCECGDKLPVIDGMGKCYAYQDPDFMAMQQKFAADNLIVRPVILVENQRWDSCLEHDTKYPTYDEPKITQFSGGFKIAPNGVQAVILDYLSTPRDAVFSYTIGAGDIVVYDSAGSTQLQWSNIVKEEFLTRLAKRYAAYVQDPAIYQMANEDKKQLV